MSTNIFKGRRLAIATKHGKEQVIAPRLEAMGIEVFVPGHFDTDRFGTFSGEIERSLDPLETARLKCRGACDQYNCTLAIASEGSFGPHPTMFFIPADDEILVLLDLEHDIEIKVREISTKTNFSGTSCSSWDQAKQFAERILFPSHGLIVRKEHGDMGDIVKGVHEWSELEIAVKTRLDKYGQVFLETDMRAMYNPTRMSVIEKAAEKLLDSMSRLCPQCQMPGFEIVDVRPGLPCSQCASPTKSTLAWIYQCQKCKYQQEVKFPKGKSSEDPMYCDWCNP